MKRVIGVIFATILLLGIQSCMVKRGANMEFAKGSSLPKDAEIVSIKVSGLLMRTFIRGEIKDLQEDDPILALALKKIKNIKVMTVSGNGDTNLYDNFSRYLVKNDFEELMSIHSDGSKISINIKTKRDRIKHVILGIIDENDHVFVDLKSNLNLDELNSLIQHYEKIKEVKNKQDRMVEKS